MAFIENVYIHGWTGTSGAGGGNTGPGTILGGGNNGLQTLDHIVIDGSDSNAATWAWGTYPSFYHFRDSIIRHTTDGVGQWCHDIHDNIFEFIVPLETGGHTNVLECNFDATGAAVNQPQNTPNVVYNNIVRHSNSNVMFWFCPTAIPEYWYNNLIYDSKGEGWSYAGPPTYGCDNTGGQFMFNNTLVDGNAGGWNQPCSMGTYVSEGGRYLTVLNEHLINTSFDSGPTACTGVSDASNISQSDSTAESQGYLLSSGGTYVTTTCANESTTPCAPTNGTNATVSAGGNHQAYCTTLATYTSETAISVDAANACKYGTTDGCAYNSTTHTMTCPALPAVSRPTSTAWTVGAYQFSSGQTQGGPQAPPSVLVTVK